LESLNDLKTKYIEVSTAAGLPTKLEWAAVNGFRPISAKVPLTTPGLGGIVKAGSEGMNVLPRCEQAVIPKDKFVKYALNPSKSPHKALVFEMALGYNQDNVDMLIENIRTSLPSFPAKHKGNKGYGSIYEVVMNLTGPNGKFAKVLTGWLDDISNGEIRLTTVHIDR